MLGDVRASRPQWIRKLLFAQRNGRRGDETREKKPRILHTVHSLHVVNAETKARLQHPLGVPYVH